MKEYRTYYDGANDESGYTLYAEDAMEALTIEVQAAENYNLLPDEIFVQRADVEDPTEHHAAVAYYDEDDKEWVMSLMRYDEWLGWVED